MRKIKLTSGLEISFSHAGTEGEALTTVNIQIPIDGNKYIQGLNIIDCIKEGLLPNVNIDALTQVLTTTQLDRLGGLVTTGIITPYLLSMDDGLTVTASAINHLQNDNAALGVIDYELGKTKPTYTP